METVCPGCIWLAESVHGAHVLAMRKMGAYCATDTELHQVFDMSYDYDVWPWYEGVLTGKVTLREYANILNYQELTYPNSYVKTRYLENHDTPRGASWMHSDTQLDNWLAFLYFQRGATMLYSGMEYAPCERVDFFENQSNYGDMRRDVQLQLRKLKEIKETLPITGGYWLEETDGLMLGHYEGPEGKVLGVFDLLEHGAGRVKVELPDGTYRNRLGGSVPVADGHLTFDGAPVVI